MNETLMEEVKFSIHTMTWELVDGQYILYAYTKLLLWNGK